MLRELDFHTVARQQPDPISLSRSGAVRQNLLLISQFQQVDQAGQLFDYCRVNTHGPFFVTATQCSKWAE